MARSQSKGFWANVSSSRVFYLTLNALQMIFAVTTLSLCGSDISENQDENWRSGFTIATSVLSIFTTLSLATEIFLTIPSRLWLVAVFLWQWTLVALWCIATGMMADIYLKRDVRLRMRVATGFVITNFLLWLFCSCVATVGCCFGRRRRKLSEAGGGVDPGAVELRKTSDTPT